MTLWQNLKTQIVTNLKNSNWDKTQKLKLWQNSKCDQTKKSNGDKTQKNKLCQYSKTQIVTKLKNSNCYKTKKNNVWQNPKSKIVAVVIVTVVTVTVVTLVILISFSKNNLTPWQPIRWSRGSFSWFSQCFSFSVMRF